MLRVFLLSTLGLSIFMSIGLIMPAIGANTNPGIPLIQVQACFYDSLIRIVVCLILMVVNVRWNLSFFYIISCMVGWSLIQMIIGFPVAAAFNLAIVLIWCIILAFITIQKKIS